MFYEGAFASDDDEDPSYQLHRQNASESPSYSLAEDGLEEISNVSEDSDYAPNLAETVSNPRQKRVVLVSDSENQGQSDEAMYTVHVCTTDNISLHVD